MINVLFFASIREHMDCDRLSIECGGLRRISDLKAMLALIDSRWSLLGQAAVLVAVNQTVCDDNEPIRDGDEVAFFPPGSGG